MKLVNDSPQVDHSKHLIPAKVKIMSDLDSEIRLILSSDNDEYTKAKLYSEALRKYLIYKQLNEEDLEYDTSQTNKVMTDISQNLKKITNVATDPTKDKSKRKEKKVAKKQVKKEASEKNSSEKGLLPKVEDLNLDINWNEIFQQSIGDTPNWENYK